jgi:hypothetical protein
LYLDCIPGCNLLYLAAADLDSERIHRKPVLSSLINEDTRAA